MPRVKHWVIRCLFRVLAVPYLFAAWLFVGLVLGLCVNAVEHGVPGSQLIDHWHSIWTVYVAQAGIGYGDYNPRTHLGRAFCIISVFSGVGLLSFIIPKTQVWLSLTPGETQLYRQLRRMKDGQANLMDAAAMVIQRYWKLRQYRIKQLPRQKIVLEFNRVLQEFRFRSNMLKAFYSRTLREEMNSLRVKCERQIQKLNKYLQSCKAIKKDVKDIQAFALATAEFANFSKIKIISKSAKLRVPISDFPAPRNPSLLDVHTYTNSARSSTVAAKIKREHLRNLAFHNLQRRIAQRYSPSASFLSRGSGAALASSMDNSATDPMDREADSSPINSAYL